MNQEMQFIEPKILILKEIREDIFEFVKNKNPNLNFSKTLNSSLNNKFQSCFKQIEKDDHGENKIIVLENSWLKCYCDNIGPFLQKKYEKEENWNKKILLLNFQSKSNNNEIRDQAKIYAIINSIIKKKLEKIFGPANFEFKKFVGKTKKIIKLTHYFSKDEAEQVYKLLNNKK